MSRRDTAGVVLAVLVGIIVGGLAAIARAMDDVLRYPEIGS